jgi:hypothetical protein
MQNYRVTYLMPRPENLMAQPDKDVPGFYRHATLLAATFNRTLWRLVGATMQAFRNALSIQC